MLRPLKSLRFPRLLVFMSLCLSIWLTGCQVDSPTSKASAVSIANRRVRTSGRPIWHYNEPIARYQPERAGWLVIYTTRQVLPPRQFEIFVADSGEAQFVPL